MHFSSIFTDKTAFFVYPPKQNPPNFVEGPVDQDHQDDQVE